MKYSNRRSKYFCLFSRNEIKLPYFLPRLFGFEKSGRLKNCQLDIKIDKFDGIVVRNNNSVIFDYINLFCDKNNPCFRFFSIKIQV